MNLCMSLGHLRDHKVCCSHKVLPGKNEKSYYSNKLTKYAF